jgi:hypothetical protein
MDASNTPTVVDDVHLSVLSATETPPSVGLDYRQLDISAVNWLNAGGASVA